MLDMKYFCDICGNKLGSTIDRDEACTLDVPDPDGTETEIHVHRDCLDDALDSERSEVLSHE